MKKMKPDEILFLIRKNKEKIFFWLLLLVLLYLILTRGLSDFNQSGFIFDDISKPENNQNNFGLKGDLPQLIAKEPFSYYWVEGQRDIFSPFIPVVAEPKEPEKSPKPILPDIPLVFTGTLKVNGRLLAVLEDRRRGKCYFKSEEDEILGMEIIKVDSQGIILRTSENRILRLERGGLKELTNHKEGGE